MCPISHNYDRDENGMFCSEIQIGFLTLVYDDRVEISYFIADN